MLGSLPLAPDILVVGYYQALLLQVRAAADLEMQQVVNEVRRQVEKEKEIAIAETKRKKWVRYPHTLLPQETSPVNTMSCTSGGANGVYI